MEFDEPDQSEITILIIMGLTALITTVIEHVLMI